MFGSLVRRSFSKLSLRSLSSSGKLASNASVDHYNENVASKPLEQTVKNSLQAKSECYPSQSNLVESSEGNIQTSLEPTSVPPEIIQSYPYLKPGSIIASHINDSDFLKELLKFRVNFYKLEKDLDAVSFILSLKFEDIRNHLIFLRELGLKTTTIGAIITKNPFILKESLDDLDVRINYLKYKKFTNEMITRILEVNARWLSYSTQEIDSRLGFFQQNFHLSGLEVRKLACKSPKLVTYNLEKVKLNIFVLKEEMGLIEHEIKKVVCDSPKLLMKNQNTLLQTFEYFHNTMKISIERIVETPEILLCRKNRLHQRHLFLTQLGKAQYDPKNSNYVALTTLVSGTDSYFSTEIAKSSIQTFNEFLKTL